MESICKPNWQKAPTNLTVAESSQKPNCGRKYKHNCGKKQKPNLVGSRIPTVAAQKLLARSTHKSNCGIKFPQIKLQQEVQTQLWQKAKT